MEPKDHSEARRVLIAMAGRTTKPVPPEVVADHILRCTEGAGWPVVEAAMQATLRRIGFARRDALHPASRPEGRKRLGAYRTRVPGRGGERPYRTLVKRLEPFEGSCDCRDFTRNSLGLCKHLFVVLEDLYASPRKLTGALAEVRLAPATPLAWDGVRPLTGPGDWLEGMRWIDDAQQAATMTQAGKAARRHFSRKTGRLRKSYADPVQRRRLVADLIKALPKGKARARIEPAMLAMLEREQTQLDWREKTRKLKPSQWSKGLGRELYAYQQEGVARFLQTGRLLLGDDMGLGKTTQAVAACHALYRTGQVRRGLVITPASLKWQWHQEWQQVTDVPATIVEGTPSERHRLYESREPGFLILNYELLLRDGPALRDMDVDMVVLDEAQRIKNWATKTAAQVKSLRVPYRLVLTGTPMENRLDELASIYDWVDDVALEPKWRLTPLHAITVQADGGGKGEVVGAQHLDTLRARMAPTFMRRIRRDVLSQLPPRTETLVPVELTPEQGDAHHELERPVAALLRIGKRRPLRQVEFLRLMSLLTTQRIICNGLAQHDFDEVWPDLPDGGPRGPRQLRGLFSPKLDELRRLVSDLVLDQGRKVVIFSQWRKMLRLAHWAIADVLAERGQRAVFFTGAESTRQRTRGVIELHDDPNTMVMLLSDAGGVGLNLQRAASACINLELPWNPAVLEQRIGRVYRLGQTEPVDIFNLVSRGGIEARIADVVANKRELFEGLFDGTSDELHFSTTGSGMAQIERLVDIPDDDEDGENPDEAIDDLDEELDLAPPSAPQSPTVEPSVQQLLSTLSVQKTPEGGLVLEAPPESAQALASLFGAMAQLLQPRA